MELYEEGLITLSEFVDRNEERFDRDMNTINEDHDRDVEAIKGAKVIVEEVACGYVISRAGKIIKFIRKPRCDDVLRKCRPSPLVPEARPKTVFHQGDLSDGVSGVRPLSTSPVDDLKHYHPEGKLYRFDIPADVYDKWRFDGSIQTLNDLHLPSGNVRPEIKVMPPASGKMNDFLVPTNGG